MEYQNQISRDFILLRRWLARVQNNMYARAMGWNNVSVYDGGWYRWNSDQNPLATGERNPDSGK